MAYPNEVVGLQQARSRTLEVLASLSGEQLDWAPAPSKWSVGEVLDHLILAERFFRGQMSELIGRARRGQPTRIRLSFAEYNPRLSFVPRFATPFFEIPFSLATFYFPPPVRNFLAVSRLVRFRNPDLAEPRRCRTAAELRSDLENSLAETVDLLTKSADLDLRQLRFTHPLLGTLDVPELVTLTANHETRHQEQIREILNSPGFPAAGASPVSNGGATLHHVRFLGGHGGQLAGVLHRPAVVRGTVIFSHCLTCTKDYDVAVRLSEILAAEGFAVLRFDYSGLGGSEGQFAQTTITTDLADLQSATHWVRTQGLGEPVLLGHSMGAAVSLLVGQQSAKIPGVAMIASFADIESLSQLVAGALEGRSQQGGGPVKVEIAGRTFEITPEFWQELRRYTLVEAAAQYPGPLLVLHGTDDEIIPVAQGEKLFASARQPKSFHALPGADHVLSRPQDVELSGEILSAWLRRIFVEASG